MAWEKVTRDSEYEAIRKFVDASKELGCEHGLLIRALKSYGVDETLMKYAEKYYSESA